jgi:methyl-accepting chemotaxis protein
MIFFEKAKRSLSQMKLVTKLVLAFLILVALIVGAGGAGLFFLNKISGGVSRLTNFSSPLMNAASELTETTHETRTAIFKILTLTNAEEIEQQIRRVEELEQEITEKFNRMDTINTRYKAGLNLQEVAAYQEAFFANAREMISAQQKKLAADTKNLAKFETKRQSIDTMLSSLITTYDAKINFSEEQAKILVQSGDATPDGLMAIIDELFGQSYPMVQGAVILQTYLVKIQDTCKAYVNETDSGNLAAVEKKATDFFKKVSSRLKRMDSRAVTTEEKKSLETIRSEFETCKDEIIADGGVFESHRQYLDASASVTLLQNLVETAFTDFKKACDNVVTLVNEVNQEATRTADKDLNSAQRNITITIGFGFIIGALFTILITRSVTLPIKRVVLGLNQGAEHLFNASMQLSSDSNLLAENASSQAAALEETTASLVEMSSMTSQNAENAHQADDLMKDTRRVVEETNRSMSDLTKSMADITGSSEETQKIVKTIDEIAFQTNLLALNAAVEAARAGEAGAGFAVVAEEVRALALRAAQAARNTASLITDTVKKIEQGTRLVVSTNEAFANLARNASKVATYVTEIASASSNQAERLDQVNKSVGEIDRLVQQNASSAEENAGISQEVSAQAKFLSGSVGDLMNVVGRLSGNGKHELPAPEEIKKNRKALPFPDRKHAIPAP